MKTIQNNNFELVDLGHMPVNEKKKMLLHLWTTWHLIPIWLPLLWLQPKTQNTSSEEDLDASLK
jgi:hypothetical protein